VLSRRQALSGSAAALASALLPGPVEAALQPSIWGSREKRKTKLKAMSRWVAVMQRYCRESKRLPGYCTVPLSEAGYCLDLERNPCRYRSWFDFLETLPGKETMAQLQAINTVMNPPNHAYIEDLINWHKAEFWATPREFFLHDGDCEDFAIAKFLSIRLRELPVEGLRIFLVEDLNLSAATGSEGRVNHAVCVAYLHGRAWVLDNQAQRMMDARCVYQYRPVYSVDEEAWWRHLPDRDTPWPVRCR